MADTPSKTVKWFNVEMGGGVISPEGGSADVYVHYSGIPVIDFRTFIEKELLVPKVDQGMWSTQTVGKFPGPTTRPHPPSSPAPPTDSTAIVEDVSSGFVPVPVSLLNELIENTEVQLKLLRRMKASDGVAAEPEAVDLESPTGTVQYTLPVSRDETYSSSAVGKILSPTGKGHRSIAQNRRQSNELLGIKIGNQFRYPKFQIDVERSGIWSIVAYANRAMECSADPWGTLDWWFSADDVLDSRRPVDMVAEGQLSEDLVDLAIGVSQRGMD